MKVVHATWEQRNLGVDCNEIVIEASDTAETVTKLLQHETEYTVVKLPVGRTDLLFKIQEMGYRYIETLTHCYHLGTSFNLTPIQQRVVDRTRYEPMDAAGHERMFSEIMNGMFSADRISLDPAFSREQANRRYVYWIKDEFSRGGKAFRVLYDDRELGFFTLRRKNEDTQIAFLSGTYAAFRNSGFGFCCHYSEVVEGIRTGAKRVATSYSSNNRGAAAVHLSMGHVLDEQWYVCVKHGKRIAQAA